MPYATVDAPFGMGDRTRPYKVRPDNPHGEFLTDDEAAVLAYVRYLEGENARLDAELLEAKVAKDAKPKADAAEAAAAMAQGAAEGLAGAAAEAASPADESAAKGGAKWKKPAAGKAGQA
jgi:hypothetical protein